MMSKVAINNLGIPPLAGVCTYEQAVNPGYSVDKNVILLKRYNYIEKKLNQMMAAHVARTPEWEVKCALSYHLWLDAEHSASIRKRISEMREPPLYLDKVPDEKLEKCVDEAIRAKDSVELLVGIYQVIKPELIRSIQKHLQETNLMMDQPSIRILKIILMEEEEMIQWGEQAISALVQNGGEQSKEAAEKWKEHLTSYLTAAKGIAGDLQPTNGRLPEPRSDGEKYEMDPTPRRDNRFKDNYNRSAAIDQYFQDEERPMEERVYALLYKRLREMDVPEWMGPILYKTEGKPWEYYLDLSRQLWDEARHAMLGEIGLYNGGVPFYKYPVDLKSSFTLNTMFKPIDAHLILWAIEQSLMPKKTGKQWEWEIANQSLNRLGAAVQDYDWADEVLHAQIGRKWLVPEFGDLQTAREKGAKIMEQWHKKQADTLEWSEQQEWWTRFMEEIKLEGKDCC
jgi:hypothetical protein